MDLLSRTELLRKQYHSTGVLAEEKQARGCSFDSAKL